MKPAAHSPAAPVPPTLKASPQTAPQATFKALADPTRREILLHLKGGGMTIAEVAQNFPMTRAAVKKHLKILADGGLVTVRARGREKLNEITPDGLAPIAGWLELFDQFWGEKLNALAAAIEHENTKKPKEKT